MPTRRARRRAPSIASRPSSPPTATTNPLSIFVYLLLPLCYFSGALGTERYIPPIHPDISAAFFDMSYVLTICMASLARTHMHIQARRRAASSSLPFRVFTYPFLTYLNNVSYCRLDLTADCTQVVFTGIDEGRCARSWVDTSVPGR
jgi:hypothetical protein